MTENDENRRFEGKVQVSGITGMIWVIGWLFTIGYADLGGPRLLYAVVVWPYYLGAALA